MRTLLTRIVPVLLTGSSALGGLAYRWEPASLDLIVGQSADVALYLEESAAPTDSILLQQAGLASVGVKVQRTGTTAAALLPAQASLNAVDFFDASDPVFAPWIITPGDDIGCVLFARDAGVTGEVLGGNRRRVLIGRFLFRGVDANSVAEFRAVDFDSSTADTVTWESFEVLDSRIAPASLPIFVSPPSRYCPADFDEDGGITGADLGAFLSAFELGDARADVDDDGGISFADVAAFLSLFEAGGC